MTQGDAEKAAKEIDKKIESENEDEINIAERRTQESWH